MKEAYMTTEFSTHEGETQAIVAPFEEGVILGIDLGTSTSCVAVWHLDKNRVKVVKSKCGERTMPSVVSWDAEGTPVAGKYALKMGNSGASVIGCSKRVIGMKWHSDAFCAMKSTLPFETVEMDDDEVGIIIDGVNVSPVDVAAVIIRELKEVAVEWLSSTNHRTFDAMKKLSKNEQGKVVMRGCVIGVPVYFNEQQRVATKLAATRAGFREVSVVPESTAAALAYGLFIAGQKTVLVFDAGGGTTDVTLMAIDEGTFTTISCGGDNMLGGEDMDTLVARHLLRGNDSLERLLRDIAVRKACADCRESLSSVESVNVSLVGQQMTLTRHELELVLQPFVDRAKALVEKVCEDNIVNEVVLVGGVSRTPILREMLRQLFPHLPDLCSSCDPATTVAEGLAIRGAVNGGVSGEVLQTFLMSDVLPLPIGVEIFEDGEDSEVEGGRMDVVLERLSKLPARSSRVFRCAQVKQRGITVHVYEGEHEAARSNDKVASFDFLLPALPVEDNRTQRDVLVAFSMDEAGELRVVLEDDDYSNKEKVTETSNNEFHLQIAIASLVAMYLIFRLFVRPHFELHDFMLKQEQEATESASSKEL